MRRLRRKKDYGGNQNYILETPRYEMIVRKHEIGKFCEGHGFRNDALAAAANPKTTRKFIVIDKQKYTVRIATEEDVQRFKHKKKLKKS